MTVCDDAGLWREQSMGNGAVHEGAEEITWNVFAM